MEACIHPAASIVGSRTPYLSHLTPYLRMDVLEKSVHDVPTKNLTPPNIHDSFSITWTWSAAAAFIFSSVRSRWPFESPRVS